MKTKNVNLLTATAFCCTALFANAADITTSDGRTFHKAEILRADPDGVIINYQAEVPGIAMAKLKFANLPDSFRTQYGYDAVKSADFEKDQAQATAQWRTRQTASDEALARYRAVAELNRSLAGDEMASYSVSLNADGKISAQGFTGRYLPDSYFYPSLNYSGQNSLGQNSFGQNPQMGGATNMNRAFGY